jgi:Domain of unknown function (DUF6471)
LGRLILDVLRNASAQSLMIRQITMAVIDAKAIALGGDRAKRYLKAEQKRSGIGFAELAKRLTEAGIPETKGSITVKINRGHFRHGS